MKAFPGMTDYICHAFESVPEAWRGQIGSDSVVQEIGDLLGQAVKWGVTPAGVATLGEAESRLTLLQARLDAARLAVEAVRSVVAPEARKARTPKAG